jgi:hypothetical protein
MRNAKGFDVGTGLLAALTFVAGVTAYTLLRGAGLFSPGGRWPTLEELDHVGSWLGGIFAPIALAWTARAFFLQKQQQAHELVRAEEEREKDRRDEADKIARAEEAREKDLRAEREKRELADAAHEKEERLAAAAQLLLNPVYAVNSRITSRSDGTAEFVDIDITNAGHAVTRVEAHIQVDDASDYQYSDVGGPSVAVISRSRTRPLLTNETLSIRVDLPKSKVHANNVCVALELLSFRLDGLVWRNEMLSWQGDPFSQSKSEFADDIASM